MAGIRPVICKKINDDGEIRPDKSELAHSGKNWTIGRNKPITVKNWPYSSVLAY